MGEKMTQDQKDYIATLKDRDRALPMDRYFWKSKDMKDEPPVDLCGKCGRILMADYVFCPICGQRIDKENSKL